VEEDKSACISKGRIRHAFKEMKGERIKGKKRNDERNGKRKEREEEGESPFILCLFSVYMYLKCLNKLLIILMLSCACSFVYNRPTTSVTEVFCVLQ
jgi:hypothetical protein